MTSCMVFTLKRFGAGMGVRLLNAGIAYQRCCPQGSSIGVFNGVVHRR